MKNIKPAIFGIDCIPEVKWGMCVCARVPLCPILWCSLWNDDGAERILLQRVPVPPQGFEWSCPTCFTALNESIYWCFREVSWDCLSVCWSVSKVTILPPLMFFLEENALNITWCPLSLCCNWFEFFCLWASNSPISLVFLTRKPLSLDTAIGKGLFGHTLSCITG